jgi:hypothetical protein
MTYKRRSFGFMFAILCTFTLLLAACRSGAPSGRQAMTQDTTRLNLHVTPGASNTTSPGAVPTSPTEYVGQVPTQKAWIGLSSTGKRMVAFVTDGTQGHRPTFAQWFRGSVSNGVVDATATAKNGSDRLQGTLSNDTATGTVTFADGKSLAFTANAVPASDTTAGLYRSQHSVNHQQYVAGWVVLPSTTGTATPSTGTGVIPPNGRGQTPLVTATRSPSGSGAVPATPTPSISATVSPSATGTTTGTLQQGGAILNEQNQTVLPVPPLTRSQIDTKEISIPDLATFKLVPCQQNLC